MKDVYYCSITLLTLDNMEMQSMVRVFEQGL